MIFLIDGDNCVLEGLRGIDLLPSSTTVLIFHHKALNLTKVKAMVSKTAAKVVYVESVRDGKNSIDFQITAELGVLIGQGKVDFGYIISRDQGFIAPIEAMRKRYRGEFKQIILEQNIERCLGVTYLLKANSRDELHDNLVKEYGSDLGRVAFEKLAKLFEPLPPPPKKRGRPPKAKEVLVDWGDFGYC